MEEKQNNQSNKQNIKKTTNINILKLGHGIGQSSTSNIKSTTKITNTQSINDELTKQVPKKRTSNMKALDCNDEPNNEAIDNISKNVIDVSQKAVAKHKKKTTSQKKLEIQQSKNITFNALDNKKETQSDEQLHHINKGIIVKNNIKSVQKDQIQNQKLSKILSNQSSQVGKEKIVNNEGTTLKKSQKIITSRCNISPNESPFAKSLKSINGNDDDFDNISRKTKETFRSSHSTCKDYLSHVFQYYCKISYSAGKDLTFDSISQKLKVMKITNFMIFCRDFKLRDCFERQRLVEIFKKNSDCQKHMNVDQFHLAIQNLSDLLYKNYEQSKRFEKMLVYLKIHNSFSFVKKMNELGQSFRMKNKRGIEVNLTPKYNFKLTMINGKCLQQIQQEVKQRTQQRKSQKQEKMEWHKKNKTNKIDQLYKNGVKGSKSRKKQQIQDQATIKSKGKYAENQNPDFCTEKTKNGYYNPCEILSHRQQNTYKKINELKKNHTKILLRKQQTDRISERKLNFNELQQNCFNSRQMKVHSIIKMAKNSIIKQEHHEQKQNKNKQVGFIKKQMINDISREYLKPFCYMNQFGGCVGTIKHQIIQNTGKLIQSPLYSYDSQNLSQSKYVDLVFPVTKIRRNLDKRNRNSKQLKAAQFMIESQLKSIPPTIVQLKNKPKQFLRATAKIQRQNIKQLYDLQEMIGVFNQNEDQVLTKHFMMERKHELKLMNLKNTYE